MQKIFSIFLIFVLVSSFISSSQYFSFADSIDLGHPNGATISGTKIDEDTNPVQGQKIALYRISSSLNGTLISDVLTDVNGNYDFTNIPPGEYRVTEKDLPLGTGQILPENGQPYFFELALNDMHTDVDFVNKAGVTGSISGMVWNDQNQDGIKDGTESGIFNFSVCLQPTYQCTATDFQGQYVFENILATDYTVYVNNVFPGFTTTSNYNMVTLSGGVVSDVDFGVSTPLPPPPEVTVVGSTNSYGSIPTVHFQQPTTYQKNVGSTGFDHCGVNSPVQIKLVVDFSETGNSVEEMMIETDPDNEIWESSFDPFYPEHGAAKLTFYVDCPSDTPGFPEDHSMNIMQVEDEIQEGGNIYIDPSGKILDACTNNPIQSSTVTLLKEYPPTSGMFVVPEQYDNIPDINPQITDLDGYYGWVVIPGTYKVVAEHANYATSESINVVIPPAVTDLDISLVPNGGCPTPTTSNQFLYVIIGIVLAIGVGIIITILIRKKKP